jgi:hypothetical protein
VGEDEIVRKMRAELKRGITYESQALYLMVEIRKLLDKNRKAANPYNSLRLYSDWAVHVELSGPQAQGIVKKADAFYQKLKDGTHSEADTKAFAQIFGLDAFRDELKQFFTAHHLPSFSEPEWHKFLGCFLGVIQDCPLSCSDRGGAVQYVDQVVIVSQAKRILDGNPQPVIWALLYDGELKTTYGGTDPLPGEVENAIKNFVDALDA